MEVLIETRKNARIIIKKKYFLKVLLFKNIIIRNLQFLIYDANVHIYMQTIV